MLCFVRSTDDRGSIHRRSLSHLRALLVYRRSRETHQSRPVYFIPLPGTSTIPFSNASFLHILPRDSVVGLDRALVFSTKFCWNVFLFTIYILASLNITNQDRKRICLLALDGFEFSPRFLILFVTRSTLIQGNRADVQRRSSRLNLFVGLTENTFQFFSNKFCGLL